MSTTDVLVVGAGPAGMTLAMELAMQGINFRIIEKAAERSDKSRALGVHSRTLEVLNRYGGHLEELLAKSNRIPGNSFWVGGKRYEGFDTSPAAASKERTDTRFAGVFTISQVDTEAWMERQLAEEAVTIERPVTVKSIVQDEGGAVAVLVQGDGTEETVHAKYVVGCDGAHSVVRHSMHVEFEGEAYAQEFILTDTLYDWSEGQGKAHIFIGDGLIMVLPMAEGRARFVASRPSTLASDAEPSTKDFQDFINDMLPDDKPKPQLHSPYWLARFHLHQRCATSYRDGKLFVAGDAAHIHSPIGGQGMNTGIQDSVNLGWKLAAVLRGEKPDAFLDTYHEERWPVGQYLLKQTDRMFTFLSTQQPDLKFMRNWLLPHALPSITSTPEASRNLMRYFSQIAVKYRRSSIVHSAARFEGPVRGGYRAPDGKIVTADGQETYLQDLLRGPGFHLLLFSRGDGKDLKEVKQKFLGAAKGGAEVHHINEKEDVDGSLHTRYGFTERSGYAYVRPDGYIQSIGYFDSFDEVLKEL